MATYKLIWDDFCSYFLEIVKPAYQHPMDGKSYNDILTIFENLMQMLHPFMPFITEELWHGLKERGENESVMVSVLPKWDEAKATSSILNRFTAMQKVVEGVRRIRNDKNIAPKNALDLLVLKKDAPDG